MNIKSRLAIGALSFGALVMISMTAHAADWQYPQARESITISPSTSPATQLAALTPATDAPTPFFNISQDDVNKSVAAQIQAQGVETKTVHATMNPGMPPVIYSANHPLKVTVQALQIDAPNHRWQGQAYILGDKGTETIRPVAGRYETLASVPMLKRQLVSTDVIEASDLEMHDIPERQLHKDTLVRAESMIGKSPRRVISANRPIREAEISMPIVIKKGQMVQMTYTTPYIHIRDQGEALEDGATGAIIRVKNTKTSKAVTARVEGAGHVETNTDTTM